MLFGDAIINSKQGAALLLVGCLLVRCHHRPFMASFSHDACVPEVKVKVPSVVGNTTLIQSIELFWHRRNIYRTKLLPFNTDTFSWISMLILTPLPLFKLADSISV